MSGETDDRPLLRVRKWMGRHPAGGLYIGMILLVGWVVVSELLVHAPQRAEFANECAAAGGIVQGDKFDQVCIDRDAVLLPIESS